MSLRSLVLLGSLSLWLCACGSDEGPPPAKARTGSSGKGGSAGGSGQPGAGQGGAAGAGQGGGKSAGQGGAGTTGGTGASGGQAGTNGDITVAPCAPFVEPPVVTNDSSKIAGKLTSSLCTVSPPFPVMANDFSPLESLAATEENGQMALYLKNSNVPLVRYKLTSTAPCKLEQDTEFKLTEGADSDEVSADDQGHLFGNFRNQSYLKVAGQISPPGPSCPLPPNYGLKNFSVDAGGSLMIGYLGQPFILDRNTVATWSLPGCKVSAFDLCAGYAVFPYPVLDHKGRIHAHGPREGDKIDDVSLIVYDLTGKPLFSYGGDVLFKPGSVVRCKTGICTSNGITDRVVTFTDDGVLVDMIQLDLPDNTSFERIAAVPSGPVFYAANFKETDTKTSVLVTLVTGL